MNSINKKFEITHPQKRIWYNEILFPGTSMHNIVSKIYIGGNLDIHLLEKTINLIIKKNDSFRLKFYEEDGKLYEYVEEYKFINVPFLDFTMYKNNAEKQLDEFCINEGRKTLYRQNELLFKFFIYKINDENMGICFFIHHLIFDGMSCNLLIKQFCNIYNQLCSNKVVNSNVENSYIDFIYDENKYLSSKEFKENKQFWNEKFSNLNENSLYVNPKSTKSRIKSFTLSQNMQKGLEKFLNDKNISLNKFFISISSIYMSRILNDNDITLAVACFNRDSERQKNTIGMFTGTMPLRINIKDNITFNEFLDYLNMELKSCYHNQKYPYDLLVQDLELKRKGFDSLFKFCVNYYVLDSYNLEASNNMYTYNEILAQEHANIPLHIFIKKLKRKENIQLEIHYRIEDYTEQQITQMLKGMEVIAIQIINNPNMKISQIQVVSEEEKNIILNKFNNTKREYAENKTVKELFEDIAKRFQNRTAVVSNGEYLTYKELNERANQLGRTLIKNGVVKEDIIPILCDRSVDTIVGMLAIIKSGAAYLPIDEDYPEARINYMIKDSRSKLLLIKKHQLKKINLERTSVQLIDLKSADIFKESKENLKNINTPKDLVYVIYTSGSTGNPKGVCVENKNLVKLVNNPDCIEINENDRVLQSGSLSFDASVFQIWIALLNGAALHLENKLLTISDIELENYISHNKITVMLMPTPLFNQYCDINIGIFKNLKYLMAGGDVLSSKKVSRIKKTYKNLKIMNIYGPTENTVVSTAYEVKEDWDENRSVPIGVPISNSTAYIMDKNNNLLPIGVAGELCVGGDGISRGYLNRKDLTKEKFIENPYVKGEKIYKTGDFAKWLPDGNIHFIGRMDYQVKINGFRIELQEIEAKLLKYSKLKEAVVAAQKDKDGNKYLCAYVVSKEKVSSKEIRDFLKKEIPGHMIPSHIMQLESMPVNSNGKVDRKALPIPDLSAQSDAEFIEPRNEMEQKLENIWCKVLNIKKVSVKDNFFELGGNSLTAIRLVSKIHKELKYKIVVTDIFNKPSIEELAEYLKGNISDGIAGFKQIKKANKADYYEASPVQKRLYAVNQTNVNSTNYNIPLVYVIKGNFDRYRFEKSICKLINRHEALRTSFHVIDGDIFQKIHAVADFKTKYIYAGMKFDKNKFQAKKFIKPFDLSKSPLIRAFIIEFLDAFVLIIDMHHIISDGVSVGIIMKELSELYNEEKLNELRIQYKDYSNWVNNMYEKNLLKEQENYWLNEFKGKPFEMNVCLNGKKVLNKDFKGNTIKFKIDKKLTSKINKTLNNLGITKFMFYISAYYVLLYKYTGQEDLIIGTPVSGRTNEDIKDTVGMFVNMLPLRSNISGNMSFKEVLSEVKSNSLNAFENQEYDLKNLIEKLNINDTSLFNITFSFQNLNIDNLSFKDTEISMYNLKSETAKFDVSMILKENKEYTFGELEYKKSVYSKKFMENFANHYINILSEVTKDFSCSISEIDILSKREKSIILNNFNNTKREYAENITIKELFEEIAERFKDKTALVSNGERLTYKELNERANQLGNILVKKGVVKEDIIPILCDRSVDTIIAMLAIIKSGAAYLPIDEEYPETRINYMIKDSRSKLLLIKKHQLEKINLEKINVQLIDLKSEEIFKGSKENLENINTPRDLVYVIYTSGSTGNPKGVCVENRNLVKLVNNPDYIEIKENDKVLQCGSLSFDTSVFQIWVALLNGAALHLENKVLTISDIELENYINHNKITIMVMPTPLFNQYCDNNVEIFKNLRYLMVGGDVLSSKKVSKIKRIYKNLKLVNGYGPTENTVISTVYEIKEDWDENKVVPIGVPISNSTAYIMDKNNNLLPIGVPGELCVGGDGISRGYLNREDLTKEKFIENPYVKGEKIYKTGDFAKWLPDGNIYFMGRIDYQVKINGFRIELQEIENNLLRIEGINAAVVLEKCENENNYLCAYYLGEKEYSVGELRKELKNFLPEYMLPSYFVKLDSMPLTPNGKVDRKALPNPEEKINMGVEYEPPRNKIEKNIMETWQDVLGLSTIGINDDFFEIGGNSLKAISVVSKLSREFSIVINDIFEYPTIRELALNIKSKFYVAAKGEIAATTGFENEIPHEIKVEYDRYIHDIEKYKKVNLNKEVSYKNILLTGATGYVGVNILKEIMINTDSKVHLLLRGKSIEAAEERIMQKTDFYFGQEFYHKYRHRINILCGDISKDKLGLNVEIYKKYLSEIDCIINSAANVKHYGKYEDFYDINVLGTKRLLDFAMAGLKKDFNQISTMSVASGSIPNNKLVMFSESDIDIGQKSNNVYVRSKLEAEKLVKKASENSLNIKIFRLGNVMFNYGTGLFQENIKENAFYKNIKAFVRLKCVPNIKGDIFDFSYVDQLSKAIILIFNKCDLKNQVFHIINPKKISTSNLVTLLNTKYKNIKLKDMNEFLSCISLKGESDELREYVDNIKVNFGLLDDNSSTRFITVNERTNAILNKLDFEWSKLDEDAIKRMLNYCEKVKFL
ncbi:MULTISPECIES: non-ribosomal peptide synthetase [Clostridium]|uniref:non-ribosomal peptide synthetase n=1 Tax=Clostridium TaxID=1485 RepID=UPI0008251D0C|nr:MULTISPECIES: non-ribosomal peptide synthetase [Clostridium]PJI10003.1 non-ribosomal peptide synthetase [Clostridium sp. CT7]